MERSVPRQRVELPHPVRAFAEKILFGILAVLVAALLSFAIWAPGLLFQHVHWAILAACYIIGVLLMIAFVIDAKDGHFQQGAIFIIILVLVITLALGALQLLGSPLPQELGVAFGALASIFWLVISRFY